MSHYTGSVPDTKRAEDWRDFAACAGAYDEMFPSSNPHEIENAKSYCRPCPVREQCLQWALSTNQEFGVWGGLSEAQRHHRRGGPSKTISTDEYAGTTTPRVPVVARSLPQVWEDCIEEDGEHLLWVGPRSVSHIAGSLTPNRLSFYLDRGRWPEGDTKRTCEMPRCVKPSHLADRVERGEEMELAATG
ncbi:WhiB family transcriptional regulator [Streptomyces sp. LN704]|uniref:WhiB family transcriptional regulator n=1 Tax=Streptomyces sp. LN704 TaxID=3112982 RepID=UPI00371FA99C